MKNKALILINIIILSIIIVALICFMIWGSFGNFNFWNFKNELISTSTYNVNEIKSITSNLKSFDLEIEESHTNEIIVEIYGDKKNQDDLKITTSSNTLDLKQVGSSFCIGFCSTGKIIVYVPNNLDVNLDLYSSSGDIDIFPDIINRNVKTITTSGDITLNYLISGTIKSTSGEIKITNINEGNISTTSGDINIGSINNGTIKSTSGEVYIDNLTSGAEIKTTSGDIEINRFTINENTNITSTSGEVDIYLLNEAFIEASTKSGDRNIKKSRGEYELNISTTSGDITVR